MPVPTVADHGGNAVDAAVAATIAGMCTDPGIIAPGGSAFITIWPADGRSGGDRRLCRGPGPRSRPIRRASFGDRVAMAYGGGMETLVGHRFGGDTGCIRRPGRGIA